MWATRSNDLDALLDEAADLQNSAGALTDSLNASLQNIRVQFNRLSSLFQASRGHPTEQVTLVQQMLSLQSRLKKNLAPLETIAAGAKQKLDEIEGLRADLANWPTESTDSATSSQAARGLRDYTKKLTGARRTLTANSLRLTNLLAPAKSTAERIDQAVTEIEGSLVDIWQDYYLTSSSNTLSALASTPALLADWAVSLDSRLGFAYPQSVGEWFTAVKSFAVSCIIMAALGFLALGGARGLPTRWREACEHVIKGAWLWIGIGIAVLSASSNQYGGIYLAFTISGTLIIIAGIGAMAWRLRIAGLPSLISQPSPIVRLYTPAAIGMIMLYSDLPTRILGIVWCVFMVIFMVLVISFNRKRVNEDSLPLVERLSYGCAFYFGLASLLVAIIGYARLAILLFMLSFALATLMIMCAALIALFDMLANHLFGKETQPVRNALAIALAVPVSIVMCLVCMVPWLWAVPGATYLLQRAMSFNYQLGQASFQFSNILIIFFLFFLFRSFIRLGKTSLEHLPDRIPHMERGVLPSLGLLLTYGFWAVFILISLGLLGVNFTSLAVVAGGLSVGIGFGMQNIFNNLISGLMLIFGRTILVGDYVEVSGAQGVIHAINIRSTVIQTPERALVYVPNSAIVAGQLTNWTRNSRIVRRGLTVGVAYGSDVDLVTELLTRAAETQDHVLKYPALSVFFTNFSDNSLEFTLNVFIDDFDNATSVMSAIRFTINRLFNENGIDMPFPQLTVHMPETAAPGERPEKESLEK